MSRCVLGGGDLTTTPLVVYSPSLDRWISFRCNGAMCLNYTSGSYRILSVSVAAFGTHRSLHARSVLLRSVSSQFVDEWFCLQVNRWWLAAVSTYREPSFS